MSPLRRFRPRFDKASPLVVAHRAEYHHSIATAQLRVSDAATFVRHDKIFWTPKTRQSHLIAAGASR